jgi:hypothetical protein
MAMEDSIVFFNGTQILSTDSPEDAEIIEHTKAMIATPEKVKVEES